jgi:hypothetical protein
MSTDITDEDTLRQVVDRLQQKYPDMDRAALDAVAREEFIALSGRPVRDYISILTERAARKRIKKTIKTTS